MVEKARAIAEAAARQNPDDFRFTGRIAILSRDYGAILRRTDPRRALRMFDEALAYIRATPNARSRREMAGLLANSSYALRDLGQVDEALARIDEALALLRETGQPLAEVEHTVRALADHYLATGHTHGAVDLLEQLRAGLERWNLNLMGDLRDAAAVSRTWDALERAYAADGQGQRARAYRRQRRELWNAWAVRQPRNAFVLRQREDAR